MPSKISDQARTLIEGMVTRTMRAGGHIGDLEITNVRALKRGYAADVTATRCGGKYAARYRATVGAGRYGGVSVKRVSDVQVTR